MNEIKSIELVFENCESFEVPINCIGDFHIGGIHTEINRVACNSIAKLQFVDEVALEIFSDIDAIPYHPFEMEDKMEVLRLNRIIDFCDITQILVNMEDGSCETYYVDYDEGEHEYELGAPNINQRTYCSDLGNAYVVIAKDKGVWDFFSYEAINDSDEISFKRDMYDIGIQPEYRHDFTPNSIPDMYRYVYLYDESDEHCSLAVRVYDEESGWKFMYPSLDSIIPLPSSWEYLTTNMVEFIEEEYPDYTIEKIKTKYPIPKGKEVKDSSDTSNSNEKIDEDKNKEKSFNSEEIKKVIGLTEDDIKDALDNAKEVTKEVMKKTGEIAEKGLYISTEALKVANESEFAKKIKRRTSDALRAALNKVENSTSTDKDFSAKDFADSVVKEFKEKLSECKDSDTSKEGGINIMISDDGEDQEQVSNIAEEINKEIERLKKEERGEKENSGNSPLPNKKGEAIQNIINDVKRLGKNFRV